MKPDLAVATGKRVWNGGLNSAYGLRFLNMADPTHPVILGKMDNVPDPMLGCTISGNYAFVLTGADVKVVDLSNLSAPSIIANYPAVAISVTVRGNYAYVAGGTQGLRIHDISNPTSPVSVGSLASSYNMQSVKLVGNATYVAANAALLIVDISIPSNPTLLGQWKPSSAQLTLDVHVVGNLAYLGNSGSFGTMDVSNPAAPVYKNTLLTPGQVRNVFFDGTWIFTSDTKGTLDTIKP